MHDACMLKYSNHLKSPEYPQKIASSSLSLLVKYGFMAYLELSAKNIKKSWPSAPKKNNQKNNRHSTKTTI